MVTVAIIGIVMAAGIVAFSNTQKNARDARRRADADVIAKALEQYYQNNNEYPYTPSNSNPWSTTVTNNLGIFFPTGSPPVDPLNNGTYFYVIRSVNQNRSGAADPQTRFCVAVRLEKSNGNCSGATTSTVSDPNSNRCNWVTPGTGSRYCVQNRQ